MLLEMCKHSYIALYMFCITMFGWRVCPLCWIDELNNEHWLLLILLFVFFYFLFWINLVAFSQCHVHMLHKILHIFAFLLYFLIWLFFSCCNVGSEPLTVCPDMSCGEVTQTWWWCVESVTAPLAWCESPASAFILDANILYKETLIKNQSWIIVVHTLIPDGETPSLSQLW